MQNLTTELELAGFGNELNNINLHKEIWLADRISTYNHTFISKAAKNDRFTNRQNKYNGYLKKLNQSQNSLQHWEYYSDINCAEILGLTTGSLRSYLVNRCGGMSKTSKIYAALKTEYLNNVFLKPW